MSNIIDIKTGKPICSNELAAKSFENLFNFQQKPKWYNKLYAIKVRGLISIIISSILIGWCLCSLF